MVDDGDSMAVTLRRRRFTLDEYHRMGATGILGPDDRVELIEGEIIEMAPIGSRHAAVPLYVRAGLAEAWLVDRDAGRVEMHRGPGGAGCRRVAVPRADERFSPAAVPDLTITLRDLLG